MSTYHYNPNNPIYNSQQLLNLYHFFNHPQNNQLLINKTFGFKYPINLNKPANKNEIAQIKKYFKSNKSLPPLTM